MLEQGRIDADALDGLKLEIKEEMPDWLENLRQFDDVDWDDFAESTVLGGKEYRRAPHEKLQNLAKNI